MITRRIPLRCYLLPALLAAFSSCNTLEFYERQAFADPTMDMSEEATWVHFEQKVRFSSEGAIGGLGTGAGGGCGCY